MSRRNKILLSILALIVLIWLTLGAAGVYIATMPHSEAVGDRDEIGGSPVESVRIRTGDGLTLAAWLVKSNPDQAVIFLHGISANRRQGISRAAFYQELGYSVLLLDARGSGESDPAPVTIGWTERKDLIAAYAFLRERGYKRIAAHGISMGAATIAYALPEIQDFDFIVLESCYDTLDNAWRNRLAMFNVPHAITLPMRLFMHARTGAPVRRLQPVDYMQYCTMPALIMAGDAEPELKAEETRDIFDRCAAPLKRLHFFKDGRHENFLGRYPDEFREVLSGFLNDIEEHRAQGLSLSPKESEISTNHIVLSNFTLKK